MRYYIYDGSFQGLLTAIYESYYRSAKPEDILPRHRFTGNLFAQVEEIDTDEIKADKVFQAIKNKISPTALRRVFYAFLSEITGVELLIYRYLQLGWKVGRDIDRHLTDHRVAMIHKISQKVGLEKHRLLGLIRFRKLKGEIYYAPIEPDYNIVSLVAPHFARRLSDQNWVIHDRKRDVAVLYNQKEWVMTVLDPGRDYVLAEEEKYCQQMWKNYFRSASVPGRTNLKLQRQFMPTRYWRYLIEKQ
ncbi:putative DNA metabolism protein [Desulfohalotomaculum tongense]|uniref:TIGR03915 family putative DNA repair protein n=1 Tax=Desulforadius tongensis TaxID=1216062 RepID=UPI001959A19A|nr:TIGR03915 family putative DNA repair protein [Desulforadius tongensis]MBM7854562.1 putative DNA metabolism protein [Desulforadius tongensis]